MLEAAGGGSKGTGEVGTLLEHLEKYTRARSEQKQNDTIENNSMIIRQQLDTARDLQNRLDCLKARVHTLTKEVEDLEERKATLTDQIKELEEQAKLEESKTSEPPSKKIKTHGPLMGTAGTGAVGL